MLEISNNGPIYCPECPQMLNCSCPARFSICQCTSRKKAWRVGYPVYYLRSTIYVIKVRVPSKADFFRRMDGSDVLLFLFYGLDLLTGTQLPVIKVLSKKQAHFFNIPFFSCICIFFCISYVQAVY